MEKIGHSHNFGCESVLCIFLTMAFLLQSLLSSFIPKWFALGCCCFQMRWGWRYGSFLQVDSFFVDLQSQEAPPLPPSGFVEVQLQLGPLGSVGEICNQLELAHMVRSVATTLQKVHSVGLVHRDVRLANILNQGHPLRWLLIDWELAGFVGEKVWWHSKGLPPFAQPGQEYNVQGDLWQLGNTINRHARAGPEAQAFAARMMGGEFADAKAVLNNMWA